jgi:hypothetical protein
MLITKVIFSKAVLERSNSEIASSNPARDMKVFSRFSVFYSRSLGMSRSIHSPWSSTKCKEGLFQK